MRWLGAIVLAAVALLAPSSVTVAESKRRTLVEETVEVRLPAGLWHFEPPAALGGGEPVEFRVEGR